MKLDTKYNSCLHVSMRGALEELSSIGAVHNYINDETVAGNEDFSDTLKDMSKKMGAGSLTAVKWVGGKSLDLLNKGFKSASTQLRVKFSSNRTLIASSISHLKTDELKDKYTLSESELANLTSDGKWGSLESDISELAEVIVAIKRHGDELNGYLEKRLSLIKKISGVKDDSSAIRLYEENDELEYPIIKFDHSSDGVHSTNVLPGGKVLTQRVNDKSHRVEYSMSTDRPTEPGMEISPDGNDLTAIMNKLKLINDYHLGITKMNDRYLSFLKKWGDGVKAGYKTLDSLDGLSSPAKKGLENMLNGDDSCLAFYSGFAPRVATYVDKYIHDMLVLTNKFFI